MLMASELETTRLSKFVGYLKASFLAQCFKISFKQLELYLVNILGKLYTKKSLVIEKLKVNYTMNQVNNEQHWLSTLNA